MRTNRRWSHFGVVGLAFAAVLTAGCGLLALERKNFPSTALGEEGQGIFLDDIREIVNDPALSDEDKLDALRDLGIEDEDLLDALLATTSLRALSSI